MMFDYATNETLELMPTPISLAHKLAVKAGARFANRQKMAYLRPDGKSQVTVEYDSDHKPVRVDAVVDFDAACGVRDRILKSTLTNDQLRTVILGACDRGSDSG